MYKRKIPLFGRGFTLAGLSPAANKTHFLCVRPDLGYDKVTVSTKKEYLCGNFLDSGNYFLSEL
jgi:hypothetical protein